MTWPSGSLLARLNFAAALATNRVPGTVVDIGRVLPTEARADRRHAYAALVRIALGGDVTEATARSIGECVLDPDAPFSPQAGSDARLGAIAAALLGSPEFQSR